MWDLLAVAAMLMATGCSQSGDADAQSAQTTPPSQQADQHADHTDATQPTDTGSVDHWVALDSAGFDARRKEQQELTFEARSGLELVLKTRLMGEIQTNGPVSAVGVCSDEAPEFAQGVGEKYGLQIGRTSFKLRNPQNAAPDWMADVVEQRAEEPMYFGKGADSFAAAYPIRIATPCLVCHGSPDTIAQSVGDAIKEHYPDDQATGFALGDLRGWFWVEIDG